MKIKIPWQRLNFMVQRQLQSNWCWAAVSVSVADYYEAATWAPLQPNWRWCRNCQGLFFAGGEGAFGACPAGGPHQTGSAENYCLHLNAPVPGAEGGWRYCSKCRGIAWAEWGPGTCPAGGTHDHGSSGAYVVLLDQQPPGNWERDWRWCNRCHVLYWAGSGSGQCPSGGGHDKSKSGDYALFYTSRTQCDLVNKEYGQTTCCSNGDSGACNKGNDTEQVLNRLGRLAKGAEAATYSEVKAEIDAGRPVALRIAWKGGGTHAIVVEGYQRSGTERVAVEDPGSGSSDWNFDQFKTSYNGSGTWIRTFFTKA